MLVTRKSPSAMVNARWFSLTQITTLLSPKDNKVLVSYHEPSGTLVLTGQNGMEKAAQLVTEFFQSIQAIVQVRK